MNYSVNSEGPTVPEGNTIKSFEHDGITLDTSGYDTTAHSGRHTYYAVYRHGRPTDLVREQPSGKLISIIDTMRERERDKRAKWQESVFKRTGENAEDFMRLTFEEVQTILSNGLKEFGRAKRPTAKRKSYSAETKRQVVEARESGSSWKAIENLYGVPAGTARRWVEAAEEV